jgi:hypothetical protein
MFGLTWETPKRLNLTLSVPGAHRKNYFCNSFLLFKTYEFQKTSLLWKMYVSHVEILDTLIASFVRSIEAMLLDNL